MGDDPGGNMPAPATIERAELDADRAYLNHEADVYDQMADKIDGGEVFETGKLIGQINDKTKPLHAKDYKPTNKILDNAAERGKYGKRQAKVLRALAKGKRIAAGGDGKKQHDTDDEE